MNTTTRSTSTEPSASPLTVLVTGATGKVGRRLVRHLVADGHHVRALTRRPETASLPAAVEILAGDPTQVDSVTQAARGADVAFLNWMGFDAAGAHETVTALAAEVSHVVYLSAAQLQHGTRGVMPGVWADVEQTIRASGTDWTFLRAGAFAGNALGWAEAIKAGDRVLMSHPDAVRSPVHEADVAEVAWRCLVDSSHRGHAYDVTGPEQLSLRQQAETVGEAVGKTVTVVEQDPVEALEQLAMWAGRPFAEAAFAYWSTLVDDPEQVAGDAATLIGHPTRCFAQWAADHYGDFTDSSTGTAAAQAPH